MFSKYEFATACISCSPPHLNSEKLTFTAGPLNYLTFKIISEFNNEKIKITTSFSQVFTTHHPKVLLSFYPYKKDERASPGNLLIR
jgi:hypothetical protein